MSKATEQLKPQLDRLSSKERQEVVDYLLSVKKRRTASKKVDKKFLALLERRLGEIRSGKEKGLSEEELIADLREEFP